MSLALSLVMIPCHLTNNNNSDDDEDDVKEKNMRNFNQALFRLLQHAQHSTWEKIVMSIFERTRSFSRNLVRWSIPFSLPNSKHYCWKQQIRFLLIHLIFIFWFQDTTVYRLYQDFIPPDGEYILLLIFIFAHSQQAFPNIDGFKVCFAYSEI